MSEKIKVTESSGNVFADIGMPNADEMLAKADIAAKICSIIEDRGLTQAATAAILGIDQPKVSKLMRGHLEGFSSDRLFKFLNDLGQEVQIVIKPKKKRCPRAGIHVVAA
jgi:predicted XRE-type DNA-binding protein